MAGSAEFAAELTPADIPLRLDRILVLATIVLALAGVAIAGYLAVENLRSKTGVCTITHGCQTVQQSKYGKILGVPVSVPGLMLYVVLLGAAVVWLTDFRGWRPLAAFLAFNGALLGFLFSAFLTFIEGFVLDKGVSTASAPPVS